MEARKKKVFIVCLVLLGFFDIYLLASTAKSKYNNYLDSKPQYKDSRLSGYVALNNMDDMFKVIKDRNSCLSVISTLRYNTRYINFILEDVPKAKSIDMYYSSNEEAIKGIFGLTSPSEFKEFYDSIKPLKRLNSYDVLVDTINISSDKYVFKIRLNGADDVIMPITVNVIDSQKLKTSSFWNRG